MNMGNTDMNPAMNPVLNPKALSGSRSVLSHKVSAPGKGTILAIAAVFLGCSALSAIAQTIPQAIPRGNPKASLGGHRKSRFPVPPQLIHPLNTTDAYGNRILDSIYETLAENDPETLAFIPLLASHWSVSADQLSYTFSINPKARWQDGKPVSAEDVRFSYEVLLHRKLKTRVKWLAYLGNVESVEVLDKHTVRFRVKRDHFRNLINLASLRIVPRHGFPGEDPNETPLAKKPVGSGPYRLMKMDRNRLIQLRRDSDYWGRSLPQNLGRYNQDLLLIKVLQNDKVALESLKKGDLDLLGLTAEQWARETKSSPFGLGRESGQKLIKIAVENKQPRSYSYVGWNLESPLFNDPRVRRAMSHLFDRETFIRKFFYDLRERAVGPFEANSRYRSPKVKVVKFSIPEAIRLLREAGWKDTDQDNLLDREGKAFQFTIMTADPDVSVKLLTLTKENMRKAGVEMKIQVMDWSAMLKLIDEYRYDAVMLGWSRTAWPDPTALWHTQSAQPGGLNVVRYRNPEVDALIERGVRSIPDSARIPIYQRIHELIHADQPYTFMLESRYQLIAFRREFQQQKPWYAYTVGVDYWWLPGPDSR